MNEPSPSLHWTDALGLAAVSALALALGGYCFGREDHSTYLPMMWALQNREAFRGDLLLQSAPHMHMLFWHGMALLTRLTPLEPTLFTVHALAVVGTAVATFGVALALFDSRPAAYLGLALLLTPKGLFGLVEAGVNSQPLLTQTNVAVCLLTFAVWLFLRNRYGGAMVLVGLAFNAQGMAATFVLCMFGLFLLRARRHFGWDRLGRYAFCFVVPALPTIVQIVGTVGRLEPATAQDVERWVAVMRVRMPHHVFPLSWPWATWLRGVLLVACFVTAYRGRKQTAGHVKVLAFAGAVVMLCAMGLVFAEFMPVLKVMQFQLWRSTRWIMLLGLLYLAADVVAHPTGLSGIGSWAGVAGTMLYPRAWALSAPLLLVYLATRQRQRRGLWLAGAGACAVAAVVVAWPGHSDLRYEAAAAGAAWALFAALAGVALLAGRSASIERWRGPAVVAILAGFVLTMAGGRLLRNHQRWGRWTLNPLPNDSTWTDVQRWCRDHTPADAMFLTPVHLDGFRCFSRRAIVGDFKDAGPHMYNVAALNRWYELMDELGVWLSGDPEFSYKIEPMEGLQRIAKKRSAAYVVIGRREVMPPCALYDNGAFAVYRVEAAP